MRKRVGAFVRRIISVVLIACVVVYGLANALTGLYLMGALRTFNPKITPAQYGITDYQDVRIASRDKPLMLAGWYLPNHAAHNGVLLVHGKDASRTQEMQGRFTEFAAALHKRGFAVLMIELRGHGQSDYGPLTFGVREKLDVLGAVDWLHEQAGFAAGHIGILGVSMGAASSLGALAVDLDQGHDHLIGAVVADCSFAEFEPMVRFQWTRVTQLSGSLAWPGLQLARAVTGADFAAARPIDDIVQIARAHKPVLLIHGTRDMLVPVEESRKLHAADSEAEYWEVEGAQHGGSYRHNPAAYVERVAQFFQTALG